VRDNRSPRVASSARPLFSAHPFSLVRLHQLVYSPLKRSPSPSPSAWLWLWRPTSLRRQPEPPAKMATTFYCSLSSIFKFTALLAKMRLAPSSVWRSYRNLLSSARISRPPTSSPVPSSSLSLPWLDGGARRRSARRPSLVRGASWPPGHPTNRTNRICGPTSWTMAAVVVAAAAAAAAIVGPRERHVNLWISNRPVQVWGRSRWLAYKLYARLSRPSQVSWTGEVCGPDSKLSPALLRLNQG